MGVTQRIVIVGGGLVGSLLAIFFRRRGMDVELHERRKDPRRAALERGRSINLVVTRRGVDALERVGLAEQALALTVAVRGRMMHSRDGALVFQPYGRSETEVNHSISRAELNRFLLEEAGRCGVDLRFESELIAADPEVRRLTFATADGRVEELAAELAIGADGAGSALRRLLVARGGHVESIDMLEHCYKELEIPAASARAARMEREVLHIWPRGSCMMMALPNLDGSFTVTLYLPEVGEDGFQALASPPHLRAFFARQFSDSLALIPELEQDFFANPTGALGTVHVEPWHHDGWALLIGDAAHAIVPFFGQGMNCGFEDCTVLDALIEQHGNRWETVLESFARERRPDAEAIAAMALDNFVEMRDRVGDPAFLLRRAVEHRLEQEFPLEYRTRYSMVTYSTIPYRVAQEAGRVQDALLGELCRGLVRAEDVDLTLARRLIRERLTPLLEHHRVRLDY